MVDTLEWLDGLDREKIREHFVEVLEGWPVAGGSELVMGCINSAEARRLADELMPVVDELCTRAGRLRSVLEVADALERQRGSVQGNVARLLAAQRIRAVLRDNR